MLVRHYDLRRHNTTIYKYLFAALSVLLGVGLGIVFIGSLELLRSTIRETSVDYWPFRSCIDNGGAAYFVDGSFVCIFGDIGLTIERQL